MRSLQPRKEVIYDIPQHWTREQKIEQLLGIAEMLSRRWSIDRSRTTMDKEDIYAVSCAAIVRAVDEWDASKGIKLTTFAMSRAKYAVGDARRQNSHAPRSLEDKGQTIKWTSFDQPVDKDSNDELTVEGIFASDCNIESTMMEQCDRESLMSYVSQLPQKERDVVEMYLEEIPPKEIARKLKIREGRVYQLIDSAVKKMKGYHLFSKSTARLNAWRQGHDIPAEIFEYA